MRKYQEVPAALVVCTLVACTLVTSTAFAQVYKCAGEGGHPVYQEMPCTKGKELRNFQNDPPEITVLPGVTKSNAAAPAAAPRQDKDANAEKTTAPRPEKPR